MNIIQIQNLRKFYPSPDNAKQQFAAVDGVDLAVPKGGVFGILGPNGAGKTTTLELIEGLSDIDEGEILVDDIDVKKDPVAVKEIIGVQLQSNEYFEKLTLIELLDLFSALYHTKSPAQSLLKKVKLEEKAHARPEHLSGGQKQRFSIACALANDPKILFLDEPTTGLDPQAKRNLWNLIRELNNEGMTIVLTTHNMEEAEALCEHIAIMDHGKIIAMDSPQNLIKKYAPIPPQARLHGNLEDVFLRLTGSSLREE